MGVAMIQSLPAVELHYQDQDMRFDKVPDMAQYKGSDYANAVRFERKITLEEAKQIALEDPSIDYFVFTKGMCMVLEFTPDESYDLDDPDTDPLHLVTTGRYVFDDGSLGEGYMRVFVEGDVVFFRNEGKWLGTAPGLADVYIVNR